MPFETKCHAGVLVVRLSEPALRASGAQRFKTELCRLIRDGYHHIVLNLERVELVDSCGLGAIVSGLKTAGPKGQIALCGVGRTVATLLHTTRLDRVLPMYPSESAALSDAQRRPGHLLTKSDTTS